ncbi:MAG: alpha/beta fold hydrolase [Aureispira sp.]|nr:alpha/beta fold hydrolase [Aureispira sp.]
MSTTIYIPTDDCLQLESSLYSNNRQTSLPKGIILLNAGTCIKRQFYHTFCEELTAFGYDVLSYDYRGVGGSRPDRLKKYKASIVDWGQLDIKAVIDWATKHYPSKKRYLIAHSMGGQVMGLAPNLNQLDKIVTVASSYGNWRNYTGSFKYKTALLWYTLIPIMTKFYGYMPAQKFGMGENWPKGVTKNWWQWSKTNIPHSQLMEKHKIAHYYKEVTTPIRAYFLNDDNLATHKTIPQYQTDFSNVALDIQQISPKDYGLERLGHFGFFFPKSRQLWEETIDWFES